MCTSCNLWEKACLAPPYLATDSAEPRNEEQRAGGDEEWLADKVGEKVGCETWTTPLQVRWADLAPDSFSKESCKAWRELCTEAGRRANPREVAEGKGHRLWEAVAWAAECRGQGPARAAQGTGENTRKLGGPGDQGCLPCPAVAWPVFAALHQPCKERKGPGHSRSSVHQASIQISTKLCPALQTRNHFWENKPVTHEERQSSIVVRRDKFRAQTTWGWI